MKRKVRAKGTTSVWAFICVSHMPPGARKVAQWTHCLMCDFRWYRPPEMLFGSEDMTFGVDLWAVSVMRGCVAW